jgi:hypothetical protein
MSKEQFPSQSNNPNEDIQGDGFVVRGQKFHDAQSREGTWIPMVDSNGKKVGLNFVPKNKVAPYAGEPTRVEFRPGETTDTARTRRDQERVQRMEKLKVESLAEHFADQLSWRDEYSETLAITPDGKIDEKRMGDGKDAFVRSDLENRLPDELYELMKEVQSAHPELSITFENDPSGKWIRYKVIKTHSPQ